jgi:hypothetical protein
MIMKAATDSASIQSDTFIDDLKAKVDKAVESREATDIAITQLEVQFAMLQHLQRMDWKLWEFYNKFVT